MRRGGPRARRSDAGNDTSCAGYEQIVVERELCLTDTNHSLSVRACALARHHSHNRHGWFIDARPITQSAACRLVASSSLTFDNVFQPPVTNANIFNDGVDVRSRTLILVEPAGSDCASFAKAQGLPLVKGGQINKRASLPSATP